jgi:hypothetical protein
MTSVRRYILVAIFVFCVAFVMGWAPSAQADTYTYFPSENFTNYVGTYNSSAETSFAGSSFTITGTLGDNTNDLVFLPDSFNYSDGFNTISSSDYDAPNSQFSFSTDALGNVTDWAVYVENGSDTLVMFGGTFNTTCLSITGTHTCDYTGSGAPPAANFAYDAQPGTWVDTPEPSSLLMTGTSLLGLLGMGLRRKPLA